MQTFGTSEKSFDQNHLFCICQVDVCLYLFAKALRGEMSMLLVGLTLEVAFRAVKSLSVFCIAHFLHRLLFF